MVAKTVLLENQKKLEKGEGGAGNSVGAGGYSCRLAQNKRTLIAAAAGNGWHGIG